MFRPVLCTLCLPTIYQRKCRPVSTKKGPDLRRGKYILIDQITQRLAISSFEYIVPRGCLNLSPTMQPAISSSNLESEMSPSKTCRLYPHKFTLSGSGCDFLILKTAATLTPFLIPFFTILWFLILLWPSKLTVK